MSARTAASKARGSGTEAEKPWASGRVLTAEQRARKQEADRKANRFLKKEVQDRLSQLEARVLELEGRDSNIANGTKSADAEPVASAFAPSVLESGHGGLPSDSRVFEDYAQGINGGSVQGGPDGPHLDMLETGSGNSRAGSYFQSAGETSIHGDLDEEARRVVPPDFTDVTTTARTRPDGRHLTCFLNNLVNYIRHLTPGAVCFDDQFNQDLVVSAILKGWDSTLARYQQKCPLWDVLRLVDMYLLKDCNMVERISMLRMLHKRYLFEVNANLPTAGPPPPWFRPQFSEKVFFHDPVIDHLTWPRLRDRLIQSEKDRLTNRFWNIYVKNVRVTWRNEPFDIMSFDADRQLYRLSPHYEVALLDMSNWKMEMDFFRGIPQLAGDVPPFNYMPLRSIEPKFGAIAIEEQQPQQHQQQHHQQQQQNLSPRFGLQDQPPAQQQSLSPRFGMQDDVQGQHQPGALTGEEEWITGVPPPNGVHDMVVHNGQLGMPKLAPAGAWHGFYT